MIIKRGQSFLDAVIESTGNIENAFAMAVSNGMSITDAREIGETIKPAGTIKKNIVSIFGPQHYPATESRQEEENFELCAELPLSF